MSEPENELTPLPETPEQTSPLLRSPFVTLGVAAVVVSTVFATVATLASSREDRQAAPSPQSEDTVQTSTTQTYTTEPTTSGPASSTSRAPKKHSSSSATPTSENGAITTDDDETTTGGNTTTRPGQTTTPRPPTTHPPQPKPPVAEIGGNCPETGVNCSFSGGGSTDPDGDIVSYEWDFGDGSSDQGVNVTHTYAENGSYMVTLTITDSQGIKDTATRTVTVTASGTTSGN